MTTTIHIYLLETNHNYVMKNSKIYFTSDLWLGRDNILSILERNFSSVDDMYKTIVKNWNSVVNSNDIVYILGNFCYDILLFDKALDTLNGIKILLINDSDINVVYNDNTFSKYVDKKLTLKNTKGKDYNNILLLNELNKIDSKRFFVINNHIKYLYNESIVLSTSPLCEWAGKDNGVINLHGGLKESSNDLSKEKRINVRCDFWNYRPISIDEVRYLISMFDEKHKYKKNE